jgi:hypothetical protein
MSVPGFAVATHRVVCPSQPLLPALLPSLGAPISLFLAGWLGQLARVRSLTSSQPASNPWRGAGSRGGACHDGCAAWFMTAEASQPNSRPDLSFKKTNLRATAIYNARTSHHV